MRARRRTPVGEARPKAVSPGAQLRRDPSDVRPGIWILLGLSIAVLGVMVALLLPEGVFGKGERNERAVAVGGATPSDATRSEEAPGRSHRGQASGSAEAIEPEYYTSSGYYVGRHDPQMESSRRSLAGDRARPFQTYVARARVRQAQGDVNLLVGDECEFRVLPLGNRRSGFNCLLRVQCGEELLYPNAAETAGYVTCESEENLPTVAADTRPTVEDTDPTIEFDRRARTIVVSDQRDDGTDFVAVLEIET